MKTACRTRKETKQELLRDSDIVKKERWGRFHLVEVKHERGMSGIGISRRSSHDKINDQKGYEIAKGRAEDALVRKILGIKITSKFMG